MFVWATPSLTKKPILIRLAKIVKELLDYRAFSWSIDWHAHVLYLFRIKRLILTYSSKKFNDLWLA